MSDSLIPVLDGDRRPAVLLQFAKWPEPGRVKTRLIPALGIDGALDAHMQLTTSVLTHLAATELPLEFWWDRPLPVIPEAAAALVAALNQRAILQKVQWGNDLGARMMNALGYGLERYGKAIIVGSDCPSVDADYVQEAIVALDQADVVLGPSDDGGYVLIGARAVAPGMLEQIAWGGPQVLEQTLRRLANVNLSARLLEPRWDVDEPADWQRYLNQH